MRSMTRWLPAGFRTGAFVLVCMTAAIATGPAADAPGAWFLPVFQTGSNGFLGLSLVNTSDSTNEVSITWTDPDGNDTRTGRLSLSSGAQRAFLLWEVLGIPRDPEDGWIRIDSSRPGLLGYMTSGDDGVLDGTEPVAQPTTHVLLDYVKVNTGFAELDHTDTVLVLVNPGSAAANARADLIALDGRPTGSLPVLIPARGSRIVRISEAFRDVLPANGLGGRRFDGYVRLASDTGLAAWLRIGTPLSVRLLRGRAPGETGAASVVLAGHFAFGGASLYHSTLNIINTGDALAQLELLAQNDLGRSIGSSASVTLSPGQGIRADVMDLFRVIIPSIYPPPLITGYIRIRSADGSGIRIAGDVNIFTDTSVAAMLSPMEAATALEWTLPFAISGQDYFTGFAIANPNELLTVQTDVIVELRDAAGRLAGAPVSVSLSPAARFVALVGKEISSGYLRIRASGPVVVMGSIGTCSGTTLAFLPAFR